MFKQIKSKKIKKLIKLLFSVICILLFLEFSFRIIGIIEGIDFRLYMKELTNSDRLPKELYLQGDILGNLSELVNSFM